MQLEGSQEPDALDRTWTGQRVAIVLGALAPGSRERVMFMLAERLAGQGVKVDLLVPGPDDALRKHIPANVGLVDISGRLGKLLPNLARMALAPPAIARYLRNAHPDIVLTMSIPPSLATLAADRLSQSQASIVLRQSNVIRIEGSQRYGGVDQRWRDRLIPRLYPQATAIIAVSEGVADNLRQLIGIPAEKLHVVPNGILESDIEALASQPVDHPWFNDDGPPVVVAVGRLVRKKDYPTLLSAFARLRAQREVRLIILGSGPKRSELERLSADLGIDTAVDLAGRVANPFAYLARASLYVLSSTFEGMPSAVIEALACGCPVVSTDCPSGPSEILAAGVYGALAPVGDVDALAAAMAETLANPPPAERLRRRGRSFTAERTVQGYQRVLDQVWAARSSQIRSNSAM